MGNRFFCPQRWFSYSYIARHCDSGNIIESYPGRQIFQINPGLSETMVGSGLYLINIYFVF